MKRTLCLFLALILAVGICFSAPVTITASAAFTLESGEENQEDAIYKDSETGLKFKITDTEDKTVEVCGYESSPTNLEIPATVTINENEYSVTTIGDSAFNSCKSLTSVTIPESVTTISDYAFRGCTSLTTIEIPDSVTTIGSSAFYGCTSLTTIEIPDSVTTIGRGAFYGCTSLTTIEIPDSVTTIESYAFYGCTSLTTIEIPDSVTTISDYAFYGCTSLTTIEIPDSVTTIGSSAFRRCTSLTTIEIPDSVTTIGSSAFYGCTSLTTVTIPSSVTTIESYAFNGCTSLTSVTIGEGVTTIGESAFSYCTSLSSITIPDSVKTMGMNAFNNCTKLTTVNVPCSWNEKPLYTFEDGVAVNIERHTLENNTCTVCKGSKCGATESDTVAWVYDEGTLYINGTGGMTTTAPWKNYRSEIKTVVINNGVTTIGDDAFCNCTSLTTIEIPDSVTTIGVYAFYGCTSLASVIIPDSVTTIGEYAFKGCTSLASVIIPDSVTTIGYNAFYGCTSLASVIIPANITTIGTGAFSYCDALSAVNVPCDWDENTYAFGGGVEINYRHTYKNGKCTVANCDNACAHKTITDGVCEDCGGKYCGNTENDKVVWFYDEATTILTITGSGDLANFDSRDMLPPWANYRDSIKKVVISDGVTNIATYAFCNCTALKDITIGKNVATIDYSAFLGCSALESITVDENNANFSSNEDGILFNKDKSVLICYPAGKEGDYEVPSGVTTIGNNAFSNCVKLQSVTIPVSVTTIGEENFAGCENVNLIVEPGSKAHEFAKTNSIPYIFNGYNEAETAQIEKLTFTEMRNENSEVIEYSVSFCDKEISGALNIPATYNGKPVTTIGNFVFEDCTALSEITIPKSVTTIGAMAFCRCSSLETITIPKSVTIIGGYAFVGCAKLTSIIVDENNINYSNSKDGVLFDKNKETLICYPAGKTETSYTVPESVTTISEGAFMDCIALTSVTIPESVTTIGVEAFYGCTALETVTISGIETTIGNNAFYDCNNLSTVNVPCSWNENPKYTTFANSVTVDIQKHNYELGVCTACKYDCTHENKEGNGICTDCYFAEGTCGENVTWVYDSKTTILTISGTGDMADEAPWEAYRESIRGIDIKDGITSIGIGAFCGCVSLTSVIIPGSVKTIGVNAFSGCKSLSNIRISEGVTSIGNYAFKECIVLEEITIPESVETIGENTFNSCTMLRMITIPQNVTVIGDYAFSNCTRLTEINVDKGNTTYSSEDGVLFNEGKTELICYPAGKEGDYEVPSGVTGIADFAFSSRGEFFTVTIPVSVTTIGDSAFAGSQYVNLIVEPGSYAHEFAKTKNIPYIFNGCITEEETAQIEKLTFTEIRNDNNEVIAYSVTGYDTPISGELKIPVTYNGKPVTSIGIHAFSSCISLETVTIGNSVTSIGDYAFSACTALATVTIPDSVTTIGNYTFNACTALTTVTIPDSVTTIGNYTFNACTALATVTIPGSETTIGNNAFNGCTNILLFVDKDNTNVKDYATTNNINYVFDGSGELEKLTFTPIYKEADNENSEITGYSVTARDTSISGALTIPSTYNGKPVTKIGNRAFVNCESLTSVVIPDSVVSLGEMAFYSCDSLETVTLSSNITVIPNDAFAYCESLKTLPITENVTSIGESAFYGSGKHSKVSLSGVTIGSEAFFQCGITELTLENCKLNDASVFINNEIEKLTLSETNIPDEMFDGNSYIKTLVAENSVLGAGAFSSCLGLENVTVSGGEIANYAFQSSYSLEKLTIKNIVSVGEFAFNNCGLLETVEVDATKISEGAFALCDSLKNVKLGDASEIIEKDVFNNCRVLTEVVISKNVTEIDVTAFNGCENLKYIFFEGTEDAQKTIGDALETNAKIHYGSSTHTFNENYTVDVEPTCTEKGSESQHCKYCDLTQNSKEIKENGHTPVKGGTEGAHTICDVCKEPLSTTHNLTSKITTAPTCTEEGVETFTCECGYTYTKPVEAKGHDIVIDKAVAATCTETGLTEGSHCTRCDGATVAQQTIAKKGHTEVTVTGKAATCTATGLTDGKKCSVCGTTTVAQQTIAKKGHTEVTVTGKAATCTETGLTDGKKCSVCGVTTVEQKEIAALGHDYAKDFTTDKEPTYTEAGSKSKHCSRCDAKTEVTAIAKKVLATPDVTFKATAKGMQVNWNKIDGAESYIVYKKTYNAKTKKWSGWSRLKSGVTSTSCTDTSVKLGSYYKYTVKAVNGKATSTFITLNGKKYNVTPDVKVTVASNGIKVSWSTAANATGYRVYRSTLSNGKWSGWKNMGTTKATATSWVDKSVKSGVKYKYTVKAMNDKVGSAYNKDGAATLYLAQPTVKIANASTGVKVSWNKVTGATGYTVYRSEYKNGAWTKWASRGTAKANKTSWTDTKVASGVQYKYTVRAINGKVESTYVSSNTVLYLAQPKTTVKAVSNGINVGWTQSTGATGYTVYRMEYNTKTKKWSGWKKMCTAKSSKTNWTDKSAKKGVQYKYTVKAVNGKADSTYKASSSVKR